MAAYSTQAAAWVWLGGKIITLFLTTNTYVPCSGSNVVIFTHIDSDTKTRVLTCGLSALLMMWYDISGPLLQYYHNQYTGQQTFLEIGLYVWIELRNWMKKEKRKQVRSNRQMGTDLSSCWPDRKAPDFRLFNDVSDSRCRVKKGPGPPGSCS